jgi:hypothetical protein
LNYQTGDEVQHNVFGKGIVIESKPAGHDEQVTTDRGSMCTAQRRE